MMLRLMLLGLVASMGLELPSGRDVASWASTGRAWAEARMAGPVGVESAPGLSSPRGPRRVVETRADLAFEAISDGMAAEFAADRAEPVAVLPEAVDAPLVTLDEAVVGLPEGEEPPILDEVALARAEPSSQAIPAEPGDSSDEGIDAEDEAPTRADRLTSALRKTQEAVRAWADLIGESADEAEPAR